LSLQQLPCGALRAAPTPGRCPLPPLPQVVQVFSNMREDQRLKWYM
jgi:hypothetical protein